MQHTATTTADGSSTLQLTQFGETYHSRNGAYTEATHIYIKNGLEHLFAQIGSRAVNRPCRINIFDVGFGTALNCILSYVWQQQLRQRGLPYPCIAYYGVEKYPIPLPEIEQLNYPGTIAEHTGFLPDNLSYGTTSHYAKNAELPHIGGPFDNIGADAIKSILMEMHRCPWEKDVEISQDFILHKTCTDIAAVEAGYYREAGYSRKERDTACTGEADIPAVIFYDTFSPATQPELWDEAIFRTIAAGCTPGSVLVTYCSKGTVKQALRNAGFTLERLAGPPGKRHILRSTL